MRNRIFLSQSEVTVTILVFRSARKTPMSKRTLTAWFFSSFVEFRSAVPEEKSNMTQKINGKGSHLGFPIGPKNTNLVEDVNILCPVNFQWIRLSSVRGEVKFVKSWWRTDRGADGQTTDNVWLKKCSWAFGETFQVDYEESQYLCFLINMIFTHYLTQMMWY